MKQYIFIVSTHVTVQYSGVTREALSFGAGWQGRISAKRISALRTGRDSRNVRCTSLQILPATPRQKGADSCRHLSRHRLSPLKDSNDALLPPHLQSPPAPDPNSQLRPRPLHSLHVMESSLRRHRLPFAHCSCIIREYGAGVPAGRSVVSME